MPIVTNIVHLVANKFESIETHQIPPDTRISMLWFVDLSSSSSFFHWAPGSNFLLLPVVSREMEGYDFPDLSEPMWVGIVYNPIVVVVRLPSRRYKRKWEKYFRTKSQLLFLLGSMFHMNDRQTSKRFHPPH
mmetsp:Transcript_44827/g.129564  ORF Transcript_44827/g.129564 Transcript_44827/m.129564 type:complete len:132 (-) Transcript_44827:240-635(-)